MKIYKLGKDCYLLVQSIKDWYSGRDKHYVINGNYEVDMAQDQQTVSFIVPCTGEKRIADFVKKVPKKISSVKKYGYNEILEKCGC